MATLPVFQAQRMPLPPALQSTRLACFRSITAASWNRKYEENLFTDNGNRLWPNVRVIDSTGSVELRMRHNVALCLATLTESKVFAEFAANGRSELHDLVFHSSHHVQIHQNR